MDEVNKTTGKDVAYTSVKAVLGTIPVLGSAAAELFSLIVTPPLEKRRAQWMNEVAERLKILEEKKNIDIQELIDNEIFIDTILQATAVAIKTSEQEKLEALKNAVINSVFVEDIDKTKTLMFLRLIDSFTALHLTILKFFDNPRDWFQKANITPPSLAAGSLLSILKTAFPSIVNEPDLLSLVWKDLGDARLCNSTNLSTMMTGDSLLEGQTSGFGKEFLQYISE